MKQTDIRNFILHHRDPVNAKPKRKSLPLARGISRGFENILVDHPRARKLEPARLFADRAARASAGNTRNINLKSRLNERKETWPEAHGDFFLE